MPDKVRVSWLLVGYPGLVARGNRVLVQGGIYHVTDRCHNREFPLKVAKDRTGYWIAWAESPDQIELAWSDHTIFLRNE